MTVHLSAFTIRCTECGLRTETEAEPEAIAAFSARHHCRKAPGAIDPGRETIEAPTGHRITLSPPTDADGDWWVYITNYNTAAPGDARFPLAVWRSLAEFVRTDPRLADAPATQEW